MFALQSIFAQIFKLSSSLLSPADTVMATVPTVPAGDDEQHGAQKQQGQHDRQEPGDDLYKMLASKVPASWDKISVLESAAAAQKELEARASAMQKTIPPDTPQDDDLTSEELAWKKAVPVFCRLGNWDYGL